MLSCRIASGYRPRNDVERCGDIKQQFEMHSFPETHAVRLYMSTRRDARRASRRYDMYLRIRRQSYITIHIQASRSLAGQFVETEHAPSLQTDMARY